MVEQELNKRIRYRKLRPGTIKQSRDAINKKIEIKRSNNKTRTFQFKPSLPKTRKARPILKTQKDPLKVYLIINTQNSPIYKIAKKILIEVRALIRSGKSYIKDTE